MSRSLPGGADAGSPEAQLPNSRTDSGSQTVGRALGLLAFFSAECPERTLTELSKVSGLTVSTTRRLLHTLTAHEFLIQDSADKYFKLGPAVMQLAGAVIHRDNLHGVVAPHFERLRRASGETVGLHFLVGLERVCLMELVSHQSIRISSGIGHRYPLHVGAAGKILLAHLPAERRADYLTENSHLISRSHASIEKELTICRAQGYATNVGEIVDGASALASAVLDSSDYPVCSITILGPSPRLDLVKIKSLAPMLRHTIDSIETELGYSRPR